MSQTTPSFNALGFTDSVSRAISESNYHTPTEIQARMIPVIVSGRDAIGLSQTGSGKTAAIVLPLLDRLVQVKKRARREHCSILILSPTRELSNQIAEAVRRYGKYVNYAQTLIVGGVGYPPQVKALKRGADIIIATPGRMLDHIENQVIRLDETTVFVLDEADQMLDFGFLPTIRKIMANLPKERQMILTSATMPKPVSSLTKEFMTDPITIEATPQSRPVETINQMVIYVEKPRKNMALLETVAKKDVARAIVFTRTKFGADRVQRFLNNYGILAVSLHGNKSQGQRQRALKQFKSGEVDVLVATDIAGRGIDIDDVSHVINVDLPNIPESYVHRIGRTARAGRQGVAISFCAESERGYLKNIEKLIGTVIPKQQDQPDNKKPESKKTIAQKSPHQSKPPPKSKSKPPSKFKPKFPSKSKPKPPSESKSTPPSKSRPKFPSKSKSNPPSKSKPKTRRKFAKAAEQRLKRKKRKKSF